MFHTQQTSSFSEYSRERVFYFLIGKVVASKKLIIIK